MAQWNCNKLNTALYISFWNIIKFRWYRTLVSIYHTFNFLLSVRPEVNVDMLPRGLDPICVSIRTPWNWRSYQQRGVWVLHWGDERCTHRIHWRLWCWVGYTPSWRWAMSRRGDQQQVQDRCPKFPLDTNKDPCCHAQPVAITLSPAEAAIIISTYLLPPLTPPLTTTRKALNNNSKWSLTLPCGRTVTSQRQFGGQHKVLHDIGGSEKGVLLWTRVQTIREPT
jgi:hypothetical protein